ncbi:hypothetical protein [uncultured Alteromonas sp.]|uniref:hypothetical protein n=1 Tax=uncultured Alteromonas sp. TaxID=179113 RepID=UPI0025F8A455|nr:hypothetical protein [uncultured Alteromonas sp.]
MSNSNTSNTLTNKTTRTINKYIHQINRCKLITRNNSSISIGKSHSNALHDFYLSQDYKQRLTILNSLVTDPSFIRHQVDMFYRYIDGDRLFELDHDNYAASFNISKTRATKIAKELESKVMLDGWAVNEVNSYRDSNGAFKHYRYNFEISRKKHQVFTLSFVNIPQFKNSNYQHCRISFCPNLVRLNHVYRVMKWLFEAFDDEARKAIDESILLCHDIGSQWHGIPSFMLNIDAESSSFQTYPKTTLTDNIPTESIYYLRKKNLGEDSDVLYSPVCKFISNLRKKKVNEKNQSELLNSIVVATRYESKWRYTAGDEPLKYNALSDAPFAMHAVDFISPEIFTQLPEPLALKLAIHKYPKILSALTVGDNRILLQALIRNTLRVSLPKISKRHKTLLASLLNQFKKAENQTHKR